VGAAGARRPKAGHEDLLTYYFSISQQIIDVLPFNMSALSRLLTTSSRHLHQTSRKLSSSSTNFLDNINKLPRHHQQTFSTSSTRKLDHQLHLLDIINKLSRHHQQENLIINFIFSTSSTRKLDHQLHLLDIINKLSRHHHQENLIINFIFSTSSTNFLDIIIKLPHTSVLTFHQFSCYFQTL
jgi:hypothetical protein